MLTARLIGTALAALVMLAVILANRDCRRGLASVVRDAVRELVRANG